MLPLAILSAVALASSARALLQGALSVVPALYAPNVWLTLAKPWCYCLMGSAHALQGTPSMRVTPTVLCAQAVAFWVNTTTVRQQLVNRAQPPSQVVLCARHPAASAVIVAAISLVAEPVSCAPLQFLAVQTVADPLSVSLVEQATPLLGRPASAPTATHLTPRTTAFSAP